MTYTINKDFIKNNYPLYIDLLNALQLERDLVQLVMTRQIFKEASDKIKSDVICDFENVSDDDSYYYFLTEKWHVMDNQITSKERQLTGLLNSVSERENLTVDEVKGLANRLNDVNQNFAHYKLRTTL